MIRAIQPGAELFQRQIARHFEDEIADEEYAGAPGKDDRRELQFGVHGQRGEAEIDAIEIGKEVGQHQKRNEPPRDRADNGGLNFAPRGAQGSDGGSGHAFPSPDGGDALRRRVEVPPRGASALA